MESELNIAKGCLSLIAQEFNFNRDNKENAQKATKAIYILQHGGLQVGYGFGWCSSGPVSRDLQNDLHEVLNDSIYGETKDRKKWNFTENSWERLRDTHKKFIKSKSARELELMTSIHFISTNWGNSEGYNDDVENLIRGFRENHPNKTWVDDSLISNQELRNAIIDSCYLMSYERYHKRLLEDKTKNEEICV
jgi:hypothetical protein